MKKFMTILSMLMISSSGFAENQKNTEIRLNALVTISNVCRHLEAAKDEASLTASAWQAIRERAMKAASDVYQGVEEVKGNDLKSLTDSEWQAIRTRAMKAASDTFQGISKIENVPKSPIDFEWQELRNKALEASGLN